MNPTVGGATPRSTEVGPDQNRTSKPPVCGTVRNGSSGPLRSSFEPIHPTPGPIRPSSGLGSPDSPCVSLCLFVAKTARPQAVTPAACELAVNSRLPIIAAAAACRLVPAGVAAAGHQETRIVPSACLRGNWRFHVERRRSACRWSGRCVAARLSGAAGAAADCGSHCGARGQPPCPDITVAPESRPRRPDVAA
jgi:hypothetical protein